MYLQANPLESFHHLPEKGEDIVSCWCCPGEVNIGKFERSEETFDHEGEHAFRRLSVFLLVTQHRLFKGL